MNLDRYLPYADQPTEKPEAGQWRLIAPSGREFAAPSPILCVQLEQKTRVPAHVGLGRIARMLNEPESQGSSEPLSSQDAEAGLQVAASSILPEVREALRDLLSGWKYIREHHGDLPGVGWDRAWSNGFAALRRIDAEADHPISATQPASPARELTDAELTAIGAKHLEAHAQFVGAGDVWVEGEVEFARAVIARDRALREQGR